jgi:hypothetical protein
MSELVTQGTSLTCSMGSSPSTLQITPEKRVNSTGVPAATVQDCVAMKNIQSFGMCQSLSNPQVQAATTAAAGALTPQPCLPNIVGVWSPGSSTITIGNQPVLTPQSQCRCSWGGTIKIN